MLSSQMNNKIVFVVAIIGLLLGVAQCRPLEDSSLAAVTVASVVEDKVLIPAAEIASDDKKPLADVPVVAKDEVVASEAPKDPESTILSAVPVVVISKADSSEENKSKDDSSSSAESEESKESKESSEEVKPSAAPALVLVAAPAAESTNVADVIVPAPVVEIMEAIEPEVAVVENTVEPLVAAVEAAVEQAVAAESSPVVKPVEAEPIVAMVDVIVEPAATEQEAKIEAKPDVAPVVVEDSVAAPSSPVEASAVTKATEELAKPEATAATETSPKIIIVTPSSDVATPSVASVDSKIDSVKEVPVAPVEEITKPIESEAPATAEPKLEEPSKTTEKSSSEAIKSKN